MIRFEDVIRLAEEGNTNAMVAAIQEFVWNTDPSLQEAPGIRSRVEEYLNFAISRGNTDAMNQLGAMYAEGRLVEKDLSQAFLWYRMASEMGHVLATCNLGFSYLYGLGTSINHEGAYKAFSKAALLGEEEALVRLGDMFAFGLYVEKDEKAAFALYNRAARQACRDLGDWANQQVYSDAVLRIADFYFEGKETEQDIPRAIKLYAEAVYYFEERAKKADSYYEEGLKRAKERLKEAVRGYAQTISES